MLVTVINYHTHTRTRTRTHTHTRVMALWTLSRITRASWYQKGKTNLNFNDARDGEWHWHQLGNMQICTLLLTDNHTITHHSLFLPPNQSTDRSQHNSLLTH